MTRLRVPDGVDIDTAGPLRVLRLPGGYYVVGNGMLLPCDHRESAERLLVELANPGGNG